MENEKTKSLGTLEKIKDLRQVWKNEATDFTTWLAQPENLSILSKAIEIDLVIEEQESPVGDFSVDLYAKEDGTGRKVIIENQLEDTNHDHLGKIITYAAGKDAEVIVWIVKRARDEHKQAIEWLNQHTDDNIGFFLVEIELWKIGDSPMAPKFNVVERPNDWAKTIKVAEGLSEGDKLKLSFWQGFNEYVRDDEKFNNQFTTRKPQPQGWYNLAIGFSDFYIYMVARNQKKIIGVGLYFKDDKEDFNKFKEQKSAIKAILGSEPLFSEASKDCRFATYLKADIAIESHWREYYQWLVDMVLKYKRVAKEIQL